MTSKLLYNISNEKVKADFDQYAELGEVVSRQKCEPYLDRIFQAD